jgi:hypothetical protein
MVVEILAAAVSLTAAAFSFKYRNDAKSFLELSQKNASSANQSYNLSLTQAQTASKERAAVEQILIQTHKALEDTKQIRDNTNIISQYNINKAKSCTVEAEQHSASAKEHATAAKEFSANAESHNTAAYTHANRSEQIKNAVLEQAITTLDSLKASELKVFYLEADASNHADRAAVHASSSEDHAALAMRHSENAESLARTAEAHSVTAAEHVSKAGTLSVAVTKAAQAAASKTQTQAECTFCQRAVNRYDLRDNGDVVCKHCSDRGK